MNLINSAYKCKLNVFIDCLLSNNYSGIDVDNSHNEQERQNAFNTILDEYIDILKSGNKEQKVYISKLMAKQAKLAELTFLLNSCDMAFTPHLHNLLNTLLVKYYNGIANYSRIEIDIKTTQIDINAIRKQIASGNENGEQATYKTFEQTLNTLSKHNEVFLKSDELTVARYALLLKQYDTDMKELSKQNINDKTRKK